jgi:hypothetical protein
VHRDVRRLRQQLSAREKSRRSLMFAENATRCSVIPISSAAASKRFRISSSSMASMFMQAPA